MVGDELLDMLASETRRRAPAIMAGVRGCAGSGDDARLELEALRVEAHGLKGAALVVGQPRLGELAALMEARLVSHAEKGSIDSSEAEAIAGAAEALSAATDAVAAGEPEPPSLAASISALGPSR